MVRGMAEDADTGFRRLTDRNATGQQVFGSVNADTGETQMNGMGILHLDVKKHRLERDFRLKVRVRRPRVSWRQRPIGLRPPP